jgi:hypothetical protein
MDPFPQRQINVEKAKLGVIQAAFLGDCSVYPNYVTPD